LLSAVYDQLLPALAEQLADPDDEVQGAAARAMAKAGFLAVPSLVDGLINPTGRNAAGAQRALAQLRPNLSPSSLPIDERTLPKLVTALKHSNPAIRAAGFRLFAELGIGKSGAAAADALRAGLSDPNPDIRRHAAAALARVEE
jgi:HEAT repeat protein